MGRKTWFINFYLNKFHTESRVTLSLEKKKKSNTCPEPFPQEYVSEGSVMLVASWWLSSKDSACTAEDLQEMHGFDPLDWEDS